MGRGSSKAGGKATAGNGGISALQVFKENARQFNEAKQAAKAANAAVLEYTTVSGDVVRMYWNGATWQDRPSSMASQYSEASGVYRAQFKAPRGWR